MLSWLCEARPRIGRFVLLVALGAASAAAQPPPSAGPPTEEQTAQVTLDGEVVFQVDGWLGPFSPQERARATEARLRRIANDPFYSEDLFTIRPDQGKALMCYRNVPVASIGAQEATRAGMSTEDFAARKLVRLGTPSAPIAFDGGRPPCTKAF
jgi:hypothetical protein